MKVASGLLQDIYSILDRILETGRSVEIELEIVPEEPTRKFVPLEAPQLSHGRCRGVRAFGLVGGVAALIHPDTHGSLALSL